MLAQKLQIVFETLQSTDKSSPRLKCKWRVGVGMCIKNYILISLSTEMFCIFKNSIDAVRTASRLRCAFCRISDVVRWPDRQSKGKNAKRAACHRNPEKLFQSMSTGKTNNTPEALIGTLHDILEPMLQRELEHRRILTDDSGYEGKLISWIEAV